MKNQEINNPKGGFFKKILKVIFVCFSFFYVRLLNLFICKNKVVFLCFDGGQYGDNLSPISDMLHERCPKLKLVYLFKNPEHISSMLPNYIKVVKYNKLSFLTQLATSKVWVDNDHLATGKRIHKSKKQLFIETWHGDRGLKKCFYDVEGFVAKHIMATEIPGYVDYFLVGSKFAEKVVRSMFRYEGEYLKCGYPRNDIIFYVTEQQKTNIRKKLGVDANSKILLYAPTFKENSKNKEEIDFDKLIDLLETKDGDNWALVLRGHHLVGDGNERDLAENNYKIIDRTSGFDMSELICVADMLITDYSSCYGDFVLTEKPAILYVNDLDQYSNCDRGLHFRLDETPFMFAKNNLELQNLVKTLTPQKAKENCKEVCDYYGCYEDGTAASQVCGAIIDFLEKK